MARAQAIEVHFDLGLRAFEEKDHERLKQNRTAIALLPFSPEPRVIEKVIESAVMLGRDDDAMFHLIRYRAAFDKDHARWAAALQPQPVLGRPGG